jgi:hypothetical protein
MPRTDVKHHTKLDKARASQSYNSGGEFHCTFNAAVDLCLYHVS